MFHRLPVRQKEMQRNIKKEYNKLVHTLQALALVQTKVKISLSQSSSSKG
jgi:DNA mismatch repair protein PMS2